MRKSIYPKSKLLWQKSVTFLYKNNKSFYFKMVYPKTSHFGKINIVYKSRLHSSTKATKKRILKHLIMKNAYLGWRGIKLILNESVFRTLWKRNFKFFTTKIDFMTRKWNCETTCAFACYAIVPTGRRCLVLFHTWSELPT